MQFPNPTRLSKMTNPDLQTEYDRVFGLGLWTGPDRGAAVRERIDAISREMNRRGIVPHQ